VVNKDWEDFTRHTYFYIGDFGNNVSGNRKDLHILRIEKESLAWMFKDRYSFLFLF
jgi:hypothetical protein